MSLKESLNSIGSSIKPPSRVNKVQASIIRPPPGPPGNKYDFSWGGNGGSNNGGGFFGGGNGNNNNGDDSDGEAWDDGG